MTGHKGEKSLAGRADSFGRPRAAAAGHKGRAGFTLLELMIVVFLSLILASLGFSLYRLHTSHFLREDAFIQQQRNLRAALQDLSRELRMAGNGLKAATPALKTVQAWTPSQVALYGGRAYIAGTPGWFKHHDADEPGFRAIFGIDGGLDHSDAVTVFKSDIEFPPPIGYVVSMDGAELRLLDPVLEGAAEPGDIIAVASRGTGFLLEIDHVDKEVVRYKPFGRFTCPSGPPASVEVYGAPVHNFRNVTLTTYYVDEANNRLMAAHHDQARDAYDDPDSKSVVLADNVEDLQLFYYYDFDLVDPDLAAFDPDVGSKRLEDSAVKAVAAAMIGRAPQGQGPINRYRSALFNRRAGKLLDNRRRSVLSEVVFVRNY
jgi:prepilin-type N-terminal cleavage/methylation domain-containing protein